MQSNFTTFYIVRHGETVWNTEGIIQGHTDSPLTKIGEQQAKNIGEKFKDLHFDEVYSSDLLRAKRTTEIMLLERKLAIKTTELLRERNFGQHEGKHYKTMRTFNKLVDELSEQEIKTYKDSDDVESDEEIVQRLITFLREAAVAHPGKTILVVSHGGIMRALYIHLGYATYSQYRNGFIANTAYMKLLSDGVEFEIKEKEGMLIKDK